MPPPDRPRPDPATYGRLVAWLEDDLDRLAADSPNPGRTEAFHRLNRTEYHHILSVGWVLVVFAAVMSSIQPQLERIARRGAS